MFFFLSCGKKMQTIFCLHFSDFNKKKKIYLHLNKIRAGCMIVRLFKVNCIFTILNDCFSHYILIIAHLSFNGL